jgi:hypothetical protein
MVDLGASSNVMPLKFYENINVKPEAYDIQIIQLDRTRVKVIGELKNILIKCMVILKFIKLLTLLWWTYLITMDMLLSRDWYAMLNGYFSTDWSHLWLPFNGKLNQIIIDRERYMKHVVTDLNDTNEPVDV